MAWERADYYINNVEIGLKPYIKNVETGFKPVSTQQDIEAGFKPVSTH